MSSVSKVLMYFTWASSLELSTFMAANSVPHGQLTATPVLVVEQGE
jgi:hypothetical protein